MCQKCVKSDIMDTTDDVPTNLSSFCKVNQLFNSGQLDLNQGNYVTGPTALKLSTDR